MAKIKIHELAKEINEMGNKTAKSKDVTAWLLAQGVEVKNHMSSIEQDVAERVRKHFLKTHEQPKPEKAAAPQTAEKPQTEKRAAAPLQQHMTGDRTAQTRAEATGDKRMQDERKAQTGESLNSERRQQVAEAGTEHRMAAQPGERHPQGQINERRPQGQGGERRPQGQPGERRPMGQGQPGERRPQGQAGERRPMGQGQAGERRPQGQPGERRPMGQGQAGERRPQGQPGERRPMGQGQAGERRPQGQPGERRPMGQGQAGERRPQGQGGERRPQGQAGERRPMGQGQAGERRPQGANERRPQGQGGQYGDRRPAGQGQYGDRRPQGQQGGRPQGQGGQYSDRRPAGQGQYGDRRPQGQQGGRPQGQGGQYGDRRPAGQGQYGDRRPQGQQGGRPQGQGGQYGDRRPGGQRGGFNKEGFDKDKDNAFAGNRRRTDAKPGEKSTIKTDLVNELTKEQRAAAFNDRSRDKNKGKNKDYDKDGDIKTILKSKKDPNRKGAFIMPKTEPRPQEDPNEIKTIIIPDVVTIKELAEKVKQTASAIVKKLFLSGKMVSINSEIPFEEAESLALEYNCIAEREVKVDRVEELLREDEEDESLMVKRPPVVCVMGHVDHGKTSLLDAIRETNVTSREAGGITQHIGAYVVEVKGEKITFLDTPGHEAFTSMRMRGAKSTDIAILVVAADDGVMPQTIEAINHAKAANVQIIVAINKIDKPGANIDRVKQELTEQGLVAEDWGGDTVFVPVSAKTREGLETLLEMILLTAEVCELKSNPDRLARGVVIEAELDKGRGPVATVLVQKGTLNVGDNVAIGAAHGKVRAMIDDKGRRLKSAGPSTPVEVLGLNGVPNAGEIMMAVKDEKEARNIAEAFISQGKEKLLADTKAKLSLDGLFSQIQAGSIKELNLIIKADVQGSVEAVRQSLLKLSNDEVVVRVIHGGVGAINESDVNLASASNAIIIGFNVKPDNTAKEIAEREHVEIKHYRVIYNAIEDVELAMKGMLKPIYEEKVIGHAEVRQVFKSSELGLIAGGYVLDGKIQRGCLARLSRDGVQIYEGSLASLKRFKDDVKEVAAGYECGLVFEKFSDIREMDVAEFYIMEEVPR